MPPVPCNMFPSTISDVTASTMGRWISITTKNLLVFRREASTFAMGQRDLPESCKKVAFVADTDIDGIGMMIEYTLLCASTTIVCVVKLYLEARPPSQALKVAINKVYMAINTSTIALAFVQSAAGVIVLRKTLSSYYEELMVGHSVLLSALAVASNLLVISEQEFSKTDIVYYCLLVLSSCFVCAEFGIMIHQLSTFKLAAVDDGTCLKATMSMAFNPQAWAYSQVVLIAFGLLGAVGVFLLRKARNDNGAGRQELVARWMRRMWWMTSILLMIGVLVMMWVMRTNMYNIAGTQAGSQWGLGQVTVVLECATVLLLLCMVESVKCALAVMEAKADGPQTEVPLEDSAPSRQTDSE